MLNISKGNIQHTIKGVLRELRIDIERKDISIECSDNDDCPEIKMDVNKVKEALIIVLENAVLYNFKHGSIVIRSDFNQDDLKVIIQNTGVGITSEDRSNILSRLFYRSRHAKSINPTGMGIGLTVARAIIRAHHGELEIDSEGENKGAIVTISLPLDFLNEIK